MLHTKDMTVWKGDACFSLQSVIPVKHHRRTLTFSATFHSYGTMFTVLFSVKANGLALNASLVSCYPPVGPH